MILPRDGTGMLKTAVVPPSTRRSAPPHRSGFDSEDPVRRMTELGPRALATRELVTVLLAPGRGRERAERAADRLLSHYPAPEGEPRLRPIRVAGPVEIARAAGIGTSAAARLAAALELGRRVASENLPDRDRMASARAVYERMRLEMRDLPYEEFHVLLLDRARRLLRDVTVGRGTLTGVLVDPRAVFRPAMQECANAVVLVHNHPSGVTQPSPEDLTFTRVAVRAGETLGIRVLDHVIIGERQYYSFREEGSLPDPPA